MKQTLNGGGRAPPDRTLWVGLWWASSLPCGSWGLTRLVRRSPRRVDAPRVPIVTCPGPSRTSATVRRVCDNWNLNATGWFEDGAGTPTLAVMRANGFHGVLKIGPPGEWDIARGALLTERLGEPLSQHSLELAAQGDVVLSVLAEAWRVSLDPGVRSRARQSASCPSLTSSGNDTALDIRMLCGGPIGTPRSSCARNDLRWSVMATHTPATYCVAAMAGPSSTRMGS